MPIESSVPGAKKQKLVQKPQNEALNDGFKRKRHPNFRDFIEKYNIKWYWVKGHSGDVTNEEVDHLAREAANLN